MLFPTNSAYGSIPFKVNAIALFSETQRRFLCHYQVFGEFADDAPEPSMCWIVAIAHVPSHLDRERSEVDRCFNDLEPRIALEAATDQPGITGSVTADGCSRSCRIVWTAVRVAVSIPNGAPVLGFGANWG